MFNCMLGTMLGSEDGMESLDEERYFDYVGIKTFDQRIRE